MNFHYTKECWFTPAKTGLYSGREPNTEQQRVPFCVSRIRPLSFNCEYNYTW